MAKESTYTTQQIQWLTVVITCIFILVLLLLYFLIDPSTNNRFIMLVFNAIPSAIPTLVAIPIVYFVFTRWGIPASVSTVSSASNGNFSKPPDEVEKPKYGKEYFEQIDRAISKINSSLHKLRFSPDLILCCSRSSAVFAGIIAERMGINELLAIPRIVDNEGEYNFAEMIKTSSPDLKSRKILIVFYVLDIRKCKTLQKMLVEDCQIPKQNIQIASYFAPMLDGRDESLIFVEPGSGEELNSLPWAKLIRSVKRGFEGGYNTP